MLVEFYTRNEAVAACEQLASDNTSFIFVSSDAEKDSINYGRAYKSIIHITEKPKKSTLKWLKSLELDQCVSIKEN